MTATCSCSAWPGTGTPVGDPFTGHTSYVHAVAAAELDGRPVAISASADRTVRVWDLARNRAMRHYLRRVRLRHAAPVLAAVLTQRRDRVNLITGCRGSVSQTWDLSAWRVVSRTIVPGQSAVAAIGALPPDHVLYASGSTMFLYEVTSAAVSLLAIEIGSEIHALATHGTSTVVAATPHSASSPSKSRTDQSQRRNGPSGQKASMLSASRTRRHLTKRTPPNLMIQPVRRRPGHPGPLDRGHVA